MLVQKYPTTVRKQTKVNISDFEDPKIALLNIKPQESKPKLMKKLPTKKAPLQPYENFAANIDRFLSR